MDYKRLMKEAREAALAASQGVMLRRSRPVTDAINAWDGRFTEEALRKVHEVELADVMSGRKSDGSGRIRSSMIGSCRRAQVLSFLGYEKSEERQSAHNYASHGTALHLQWQKMGLSAGIFTDIEVDASLPGWKFRGQADAVLTDGSIFELKTINESALDKIADTGPKHEHILQTTAYMMALGTMEASIVYDARGYKMQYIEHRVRMDAMIADELNDIVDTILRSVQSLDLPKIYDNCADSYGNQFKYCGFSSTCLALHEKREELEDKR